MAEKEKSGQVWVLDTETKGTGAEMVPLERLVREKRLRNRRGPVSAGRRSRQERGGEVREFSGTETQEPRRFKLVNVIKRELVAEDIHAREILNLLADVPSIADVHIHIWEPDADRWRLLSLDEQRAFWNRRATGPKSTV